MLTVRQIDHPMPLTEEQLEEMRTAIRERLEKTNKGGTANSIANCQLILRYFSAVSVNGYTVEWPEGQDLCPDELYYNSTVCMN